MLAQAPHYNEPIPGGWFAVGGALAITVFTMVALRRVSKWSIGDLEDALERARTELQLCQAAADMVQARNDQLSAVLYERSVEAARLRTEVARLKIELDDCRGRGYAP